MPRGLSPAGLFLWTFSLLFHPLLTFPQRSVYCSPLDSESYKYPHLVSPNPSNRAPHPLSFRLRYVLYDSLRLDPNPCVILVSVSFPVSFPSSCCNIAPTYTSGSGDDNPRIPPLAHSFARSHLEDAAYVLFPFSLFRTRARTPRLM